MKSGVTKKPFPASPEAWERLVAEAPGEEIPPDPEAERAFRDSAVVVKKGGPKAVHEALKTRRARGKQKAATKLPVSIRLSPEVVEYFRSSGKGWQTAINEVLRKYVRRHR